MSHFIFTSLRHDLPPNAEGEGTLKKLKGTSFPWIENMEREHAILLQNQIKENDEREKEKNAGVRKTKN